jgi:outer membrane protein OmpA-like peptidoglycan-associated protein
VSRVRWPQVALAVLVLLLLANGATTGLTRLRNGAPARVEATSRSAAQRATREVVDSGNQRPGPQPRVAAPQTPSQAAPQGAPQVAQVAPPAAPPVTPQVAAPPVAPLAPQASPAPVQLEVQFRPGSWELSAQARQEIERVVVPLLRERPGLSLRIEAQVPGAEDTAGAGGMSLARERARALQSYVIKFGIAAERVLPGGTGPRCAECPEDRATLTLSTTPEDGHRRGA